MVQEHRSRPLNERVSKQANKNIVLSPDFIDSLEAINDCVKEIPLADMGAHGNKYVQLSQALTLLISEDPIPQAIAAATLSRVGKILQEGAHDKYLPEASRQWLAISSQDFQALLSEENLSLPPSRGGR